MKVRRPPSAHQFVLADGPGDHGVDAAAFYGLVADGTLPEDDYSDPLDCLP